jgi:hypothetical protein
MEHVLHIDRSSLGIYRLPFSHTEVANLPGVSAADYRGIVRSITLEDGELVTAESLTPGNRRLHVTLPSIGNKVHEWLNLSPLMAPLVLVSALPGYWLNRFRLSRDLKVLLQNGVQRISIGDLYRIRMKQRQVLVEHAHSLYVKLWMLRHHRQIFRDSFDSASSSPNDAQRHHVAINAEFMAHDNCMYAILDEYASCLSTMLEISTGNPTVSSFHKLVKKPQQLPGPIAAVLQEMDWYEPFRLRRANATHAFCTRVVLGDDDNDIRLHQKPQPKLFSGQFDLSIDNREAAELFDHAAFTFDRFLEELSASLLLLFHHFDHVTVPNLDPNNPGVMENTVVWTRGVRFLSSLSHEGEGWAMVGHNGNCVVLSDKNGSLKST